MAAIERATQTDFLSTRMPIVRLLAILSNHPVDGSRTFLEGLKQVGEIYREFARVDATESKKKNPLRLMAEWWKTCPTLGPHSPSLSTQGRLAVGNLVICSSLDPFRIDFVVVNGHQAELFIHG